MSFLRDPSNVKILISLIRLAPMEKGINNPLHQYHVFESHL